MATCATGGHYSAPSLPRHIPPFLPCLLRPVTALSGRRRVDRLTLGFPAEATRWRVQVLPVGVALTARRWEHHVPVAATHGSDLASNLGPRHAAASRWVDISLHSFDPAQASAETVETRKATVFFRIRRRVLVHRNWIKYPPPHHRG